MTALIALLSLLCLSILMSLGNYWYTFGLWPLSWWSFAGFAVANMYISSLMAKVIKEI